MNGLYEKVESFLRNLGWKIKPFQEELQEGSLGFYQIVRKGVVNSTYTEAEIAIRLEEKGKLRRLTYVYTVYKGLGKGLVEHGKREIFFRNLLKEKEEARLFDSLYSLIHEINHSYFND